MIPLVILDLDGTLIGSDGQVQACVWEELEKLRQHGVRLAVCTGRPAAGVARKVAARLAPTTPHIFQSGAVVAYPQGETLMVSALTEAITRQLIAQARELGYVLELYTPTTLFVERKTHISEAHANMIGVTAIVRDLQEVAAQEPVVRAQWVVTPEQLPAISHQPLAGVEMSLATASALKETYFVSVTKAGVSKGSALRFLADTLKLELVHAMAIGDSSGDIAMLDLVGYPVVMANSPEELKKRYAIIAGDVDDCGVIPALQRALQDDADAP